MRTPSWFVFCKPAKTKFLHQIKKDVIFFGHDIGRIVQPEVTLSNGNVSFLLNIINASLRECFAVHLLTYLPYSLQSFYGFFDLRVMVLLVESGHQIIVIKFMILFTVYDNLTSQFPPCQ